MEISILFITILLMGAAAESCATLKDYASWKMRDQAFQKQGRAQAIKLMGVAK